MPAPRVANPRHQQQNVPLSDQEYAVLSQLAADQDRGKPAIMRSALAVYQVFAQSPALRAAYERASAEMLGPKLNQESA